MAEVEGSTGLVTAVGSVNVVGVGVVVEPVTGIAAGVEPVTEVAAVVESVTEAATGFEFVTEVEPGNEAATWVVTVLEVAIAAETGAVNSTRWFQLVP